MSLKEATRLRKEKLSLTALGTTNYGSKTLMKNEVQIRTIRKHLRPIPFDIPPQRSSWVTWRVMPPMGGSPQGWMKG